MHSPDYRIESTQLIKGRFWPAVGSRQLAVNDLSLAVSLAAKSLTLPGGEIRVVHVPTGEIVFRKEGGLLATYDDV